MAVRYYFLPYVSIRPSCLSLYYRSTKIRTAPPVYVKRSETKGLSDKSRRRLKNNIDWLTFVAKEKVIYDKKGIRIMSFKLAFITLTLPSKQIHSDRVIKSKLLQPFLRILRNKYGVVNYVWKAEVQDNDNIHFHVTVDNYIHHSNIRGTWNTICETLGYVSRSASKEPPSTEIRAVKNLENYSAYMCSYMLKKDLKKKDGTDKRQVEGKVFDCNKELKKLKVSELIDNNLGEEIENLAELNGKFAINDFVSIVKLKPNQLAAQPVLMRIVEHYTKSPT